jgi:hypothetical protein
MYADELAVDVVRAFNACVSSQGSARWTFRSMTPSLETSDRGARDPGRLESAAGPARMWKPK